MNVSIAGLARPSPTRSYPGNVGAAHRLPRTRLRTACIRSAGGRWDGPDAEEIVLALGRELLSFVGAIKYSNMRINSAMSKRRLYCLGYSGHTM